MTDIDKFIEGLLPEKQYCPVSYHENNSGSAFSYPDPCSICQGNPIKNNTIIACHTALKKAFEEGKIWRAVGEEEIRKMLWRFNDDNKRTRFYTASKCQIIYPIRFKQDVEKLSQALTKLLSGKE